MTIQVSAFRWVPPFAQGYVRDLRVRWALEEAGLPYEAELIDFDIKNSQAYRRWQPFAQVPAYRDDEVELFESGAIVLHIAGRSEVLAPREPEGRARVTQWVIAALNSIEPFTMELAADRNLPRRRGLDQGAAAAGRGHGRAAAAGAGRAAGRQGASRGQLHGWRPGR